MHDPTRSAVLQRTRTIPHLRWWILGLLFLSTVINYVDRQALSVLARTIQDELGMDDIAYAKVVQAFLLAYTVPYLVSGRITDWLGTRTSMAAFITWWSLANIATAFATSAFTLGVSRFLLGVGEPGNYTVGPKAISEWFQPRERGLAYGIYTMGATAGATLAPPLVAWVAVTLGWRAAFVITGALGLIWILPWLWLYRAPHQHPHITEAERRVVPAPEPVRSQAPISEWARWRPLLLQRDTWLLLAAGAPIHRLMGGAFRNPVRVYASGLPALDINRSDEEFDGLADEAAAIRQRGFTGLKMALGRGIEGDLKSVRVVREKLGNDFIIHADAAGVYDRAQALRLGRELEALNLGFFELPIPPEDIEGYAQLANALAIPIASDTLMIRHEAADYLRRGGLDIVQADVCRAGGVTECRRIAEIADVFGAAFAPHLSIGSAIQFAASAHLASAMPNTITCEYWIGDNPLGDCLLKEPLRLENGYLHTPDAPGLGIELKADALAQLGVVTHPLK